MCLDARHIRTINSNSVHMCICQWNTIVLHNRDSCNFVMILQERFNMDKDLLFFDWFLDKFVFVLPKY